jgi:hypothetical protein
MIRSFVTLALALVLALLAPAGVAGAAAKRVLVFHLTGAVPGADARAIDRLTGVVARSAGLTGAEVIQGKVSYEDAAALAGCATTDAACLKQIADVLHVDHVVLGQVTATADAKSVDVALIAFVDGKRSEETYTLAVGPVDQMVEQLAREVPSLFVGHKAEPEPQPEATPAAPASQPAAPPVTPPAAAPRDEASGFHAARVEPYAWWITGGGAALAAASGVFYVLAQGKQDEVNGAPVASLDDLHRLQSLEDQGARGAPGGNVLLIAGGAALVTGVVLVVYQGYARPASHDAAGVAFRPLLAPGTAGLAVELTWP